MAMTAEQYLDVWKAARAHLQKMGYTLLDTVLNRNLAFKYCEANMGGEWTKESIIRACEADGEKFDWAEGTEPPSVRRKRMKNPFGNSVSANEPIDESKHVDMGTAGTKPDREKKEIAEAKQDIAEACRVTLYDNGRISHGSTDDARAELQAYRESLSGQDPRVAAPLIVAKANEIQARYDRSKNGHGIYRNGGGM